jgi:hypothetical protein
LAKKILLCRINCVPGQAGIGSKLLAKLRAASLADADVYTLEKMVAQFADGIARCLGR